MRAGHTSRQHKNEIEAILALHNNDTKKKRPPLRTPETITTHLTLPMHGRPWCGFHIYII